MQFVMLKLCAIYFWFTQITCSRGSLERRVNPLEDRGEQNSDRESFDDDDPELPPMGMKNFHRYDPLHKIKIYYFYPKFTSLRNFNQKLIIN